MQQKWRTVQNWDGMGSELGEIFLLKSLDINSLFLRSNRRLMGRPSRGDQTMRAPLASTIYVPGRSRHFTAGLAHSLPHSPDARDGERGRWDRGRDKRDRPTAGLGPGPGQVRTGCEFITVAGAPEPEGRPDSVQGRRGHRSDTHALPGHVKAAW